MPSQSRPPTVVERHFPKRGGSSEDVEQHQKTGSGDHRSGGRRPGLSGRDRGSEDTRGQGAGTRQGRKRVGAVGARETALPGTRGHGEVRREPAAREGERLLDHHQDDPEHGLPLHERQREGLRRDEATDPGLRAPRLDLAARRAGVGLHLEAGHAHRSRAPATARSAPAVTTRTGRSSRPPPRRRARRSPRSREQRSPSGTRC